MMFKSIFLNVSTEKTTTCSRIEPLSSSISVLLYSTAPLCHFCYRMQYVIAYVTSKAMGVRILSYNIAYHALLSLRRDPGSNPACGSYFFA
jgi:hypothetical protein